jgi:DnaJ domain
LAARNAVGPFGLKSTLARPIYPMGTDPQDCPMTAERRNLYRILHVQPEAPPEVIKAAYRVLMTTLRAHPDLGGDHDQAARLNAAWAVLGDADRRAEYDRAMRRSPRGGLSSVGVAQVDPFAWQADKRCPFCQHAFAGRIGSDDRCVRCSSPLFPAPTTERGASELLGRRRGQRFEREMDASLRLPGQGAERPARVRDLSFGGLSVVCVQRIANGSPFRIVTPGFDAVAVAVGSRPAGVAFTVHARLLTLQMVRAARGVYVSAMA